MPQQLRTLLFPHLRLTLFWRNIILLSVWSLPFFLPVLLWIVYPLLMTYAFLIYRLETKNSFFSFGSSRVCFKSYANLVANMDPLYRWEQENHPFLNSLTAFRFTKQEVPRTLDDFQAIYIDTKENLLYTFNLDNQDQPLTLEGFMIEDLRDFYLVINLPPYAFCRNSNSYYSPIPEESFDKLQFSLKNLRDQRRAHFKDIKIVFELPTSSGKRLEASLYPANIDDLPYYVIEDEPVYLAIVEQGMNILSVLGLLIAGSFFTDHNPKITLDGPLRIEFPHFREESNA